MHIPRWKFAVSYFVDLPLGRITSALNGRMKIALSRGEYKLITDNAVYSFGRHYRSFAHAFEVLNIPQDRSITSVLVLGWGIGSIADLLKDHPTVSTIFGVEHDPALIGLYREIRQESEGVEVVCQDVFRFVQECRDRYDLVCSDIFVDDKTPDGIIAPAYLRAITRLAAPGGRCLLSKLNGSLADREQNRELEANLDSLEMDFTVINTIGNRMYHWAAP
jgi:SAM-dependent methyltransferase